MPVDNFPSFAKYVAASFSEITKTNPFVTNTDPDALYAAYLAAFPTGSNPVFKERTEHDCSCCKNFIRRVGAVVNVQPDGSLRTVWDEAAKSAPEPYRTVAARLRRLVFDSKIKSQFRVAKNEPKFGSATTKSLSPTGVVLTWNHFYTDEVPKALRVESPAETCGAYRTTVQVFERGLTELTQDALDTVMSLIDSNNLYRGAEHREAVVSFIKAKKDYEALNPALRANLIWLLAQTPAARFRNTVIGTLVQDLSEGKDLERAVASFESKVAPQNYKRTSALITPAMIKKAMATVEELGLASALERRFAKIEDVSVRDVLWVDAGVKPSMKDGGLLGALLSHAEKTAPPQIDKDKAEKISIDDFVKKILPTASGVEVMFKNDLSPNLMSLTAPVDPSPRQLFRWNNDFAWSYSGNIADSLTKERVKKAGGLTNAALRISLSWSNHDDLDLHVATPAGLIYFRNKTAAGGALDVDMNAHSLTREPVENVAFPSLIRDGLYRVAVNNFNCRERSDVGFTLEVEAAGKIRTFRFDRPVKNTETVQVCRIEVANGEVRSVTQVDPNLVLTGASRSVWGLDTERFVKVNAVMFSPNFWGDNSVGNKHTFLVLDGARNDEPTRGIYNEFLHPRLEKHRKVFEVIGDKTKCQPTEGQLSGLGFSSTKPASFIAQVKSGKSARIYDVQVGR